MKSIQHKQIIPKHDYIKNIRITTKYNRPARRHATTHGISSKLNKRHFVPSCFKDPTNS
ncbi:hypothetical protein YC2023_106866 [Brassica napus]